MNRLMVFALMALLLFPALGFSADKDKPAAELKTFQDKLSYSMGLDVGTYFKGMKEDIDYDRLLLGITDAFKGNKQLLSAEEVAQVQKEFATKMQEKQAAQIKELQENNKKTGDAYLAKNKGVKGVVVTKSGLQYEVLKKGNDSAGEDWTLEEKVAAQQVLLGISLEAHPLELLIDKITASGAVSSLDAAERIGQRVTVAGVRQTSHRSRTAKGEPMLFLTLEDLSGMLEVVFFPNAYRQAKEIVSSSQPFLVTGMMEMDSGRGEPFLKAEKVALIK